MSSQFVQHTNGLKSSKKDTDLRDETRSGQPITVNTETIRGAIETNSSISTRRWSVELDILQTSVIRHFNTVGKINRCCWEVQHDLMENETQNRVETCRKLLENPCDNHFILRIVTCDKNWIYFNNQDKEINGWIPDKWRNK